jgi:hypothetical protein
MTLKDNLYKTIHKGEKPLKAIAEEIGLSENYLYRAATPDANESDTGTGCRFPLNKLIPLIKATNNFSVLDWIERDLGRVAITIPPKRQKPVSDICRSTVKATALFGEFVGEIEKSIHDGELTESECDRIQEEGYRTIQQIVALTNVCKGNKK